MPFIQINDINMYYEIAGDKNNIPLILIPGLRGDTSTFGNIIPRLKKKCFVVTVDNRGAGRTISHSEQLSTELMSKDIITLMEMLQIKKANFLGHSMGGFIVQKLASQYPSRVDKIILSCCCAKIEHFSEKLLTDTYEKMAAGKLSERDFNNLLLKFYSAPIISNNDYMRETILDFMEAYPYKQSLDNFKKQVDACINHDGNEDIKKINCKTLIISGELDNVAPVKKVKEMTAKIIRSKLTVLKDVGHLPFAEDSKNFVNTVLEFLLY